MFIHTLSLRHHAFLTGCVPIVAGTVLGYDGCYDLGTCPSDYTCDTMSLDDYG